jgi:hypothetical protein
MKPSTAIETAHDLPVLGNGHLNLPALHIVGKVVDCSVGYRFEMQQIAGIERTRYSDGCARLATTETASELPIFKATSFRRKTPLYGQSLPAMRLG